MKTIRQILNTKLKNSKFFDYFLKTYGETATLTCIDDDIRKNLKSLYLDIAFGNIQQEKYVNYFVQDPRITNIAINDSTQKLIENYMILESLKYSRANNMNFTLYEQFDNVLGEINTKYFTYSTLNKGLIEFQQSQYNMSYLVNVSVTFNSPMNRGSKAVLL